MTKICCDCLKDKKLEEFGNDKYNKDGKCYNCKECRNEKSKIWKKEHNIKSDPEYTREWRKLNKIKCKQYVIDNRIIKNEQRRIRHAIRYKEDKEYRTSFILRRRFLRQVSAKHKRNSVIKLIGCTLNQFNKYIEDKFLPNMTWENRGKWHFDHIIPCSHFDLTKLDDQMKCFHYTNYQPLWGDENSAKNDTLPLDFNRRIWDNSKWIILPEEILNV